MWNELISILVSSELEEKEIELVFQNVSEQPDDQTTEEKMQ